MGLDVTALRKKLSNTDLSAPTIQASAAAIMSFYEAPALAVSEWRNVLQSCRPSQYLPLLYVANEVLQTSKRNRGNKFLEAFGPVLGASLRYICEANPENTERVRRTVKILGDRRVFSVRFVGEILAGLEGYRPGAAPSQSQASPTSPDTNMNTTSSSSSNTLSQAQSNTRTVSLSSQVLSSAPIAQPTPTQSDSSDESLFGDSGDQEDDVFGESNQPSLLHVSNFSSAIQNQSTSNQTKASSKKRAFGAKRRRSQEMKITPMRKKNKTSNRSRATKKLSTSSFMERIQQLEGLDFQYSTISSIIASITSSEIMSKSDSDEIQEVGDELTDLHAEVNRMIESMANQRKKVHNVADGKKEVEMELKRYLVWMQGALNVDEDEMKLCDGLEEKLELLLVVHADAKKARDERRSKEAKEKDIAEATAKKKAEEEELKRSLEQIQKEKAPKEGMVWNKQVREYQYLADATQESWRD
eukprot:scaffold1521_cov271-Chaetoceros_neogracile.AAC.92